MDDTTTTTTTKAPARTPPQPSTSLLERLPTELRLQIYDLLFPNQPVPASALPSRRGALRADGAPTSTTILRLNRAIHAEAQAVLYSKTPFSIRVHPGGIALAGGRAMTYPDFDFGKRGGPSVVHGVESEWGALLRNARRLEITIVAWVSYAVFERVKAYAQFLADALVEAGPPLLDLRIKVEWHNGTTNFPVTHPTPQMAGDLLRPFEGLRVWREVDVGDVGTPRYFFGAPAVAKKEAEEYEVLRKELRERMLVR